MTPWIVAHQAPLSMGFPRQEYWSGLPFPSPGDFPDLGIKPRSPALQADSLPTERLNFYEYLVLRNIDSVPFFVFKDFYFSCAGFGNSLVVQWVVLRDFTAEGLSSIPGRGTKMRFPQAMKCSQKKKKKKSAGLLTAYCVMVTRVIKSYTDLF